jgi:hypothetical protein
VGVAEDLHMLYVDAQSSLCSCANYHLVLSLRQPEANWILSMQRIRVNRLQAGNTRVKALLQPTRGVYMPSLLSHTTPRHLIDHRSYLCYHASNIKGFKPTHPSPRADYPLSRAMGMGVYPACSSHRASVLYQHPAR